MDPLYPFLLGVISTASAAVGVFFYRFWRRTHDRLFVAFAVAFWLVGANWAAQAFVPRDESYYAAIYLLRLAAFAVIIAGVIGKNRETQPASPPPETPPARRITRNVPAGAIAPAPQPRGHGEGH